MLHLYQSNRLEGLADRLIEIASRYAASPLEAAIVAVPSLGMARWLKYRWAERLGICAQVEFPYPAGLMWRLMRRLVPETPERSPFEPESMTWRLYGLLGSLSDEPELAPLRQYLARGDARDRLALAERVAALFAAYLTYRPDWLTDWSAATLPGEFPEADQAWQSRLWRRLAESAGLLGKAHPKQAFFAALEGFQARGENPAGCLPRRFAVFCAPLLPPLYLEIFRALARHVDIDLFVLNPCREYWADIVSEQNLYRKQLGRPGEAAYREVGHPLLASWGRQRKEQLALLLEHFGEEPKEEWEDFPQPAGESLLFSLQRAILALEDSEGRNFPLAAGDGSIQVHVCHSLTRQLEVLHDALLTRFDAPGGDLAPADILVMVPDLERAAPLIAATFGTAPGERAIPYSVSGLEAPDSAPLLRAFLALLDLPESRFEAPAIDDLLQTGAVRRSFGFSESEADTALRWAHQAGARWGLDAAHRVAQGLPPESRHTWADALARLLLGLAFPITDTPCGDLLPEDAAQGSEALALGKLARFLCELARLVDGGAAPRPPARWFADLSQMIDRFFCCEEADRADLKRLQDALRTWYRDVVEAGGVEALPLGVVRDALAAALRSAAPGAVPGGRVTFCRFGALRGIPYRVICVLGADHDALPRRDADLEFDLMARRPRLGDRGRRDEDRDVFLDALMAAREMLYLSYTGRGIRDNAPLPPSVLVEELLDYLARRLQGGANAVREHLVYHHRLQPFSPYYFDPAAPLSYAAEFLPASGGSPIRAAPFLSRPLPDPEPEWRQVSLDRLIRCLAHPLRFLLRDRLGIALEDARSELAAAEPFALDREGRARLRERLLNAALAGADGERLLRLGLIAAEAPHGCAGLAALRRELPMVQSFAARLESLLPAYASPPLPFELQWSGFRIVGRLRHLGCGGLLGWRWRRLSAHDVLAAWCRHLVLNLLPDFSGIRESLWLSDDSLVRLPPLADAEARFAALLEIYARALREPLPFPARSALRGFLAKEGVESRFLQAAAQNWTSSEWASGENSDPWFRLYFGGVREDLPDEFRGLADAILGDFFRCIKHEPAQEGERSAS